MVDVIERGEPAIMVCHWPGIYFNGEEIGFRIFQTVVQRLHQRYQHLRWMKLSEIARYWAAKELTEIRRKENILQLAAPFASPDFTLKLPLPAIRQATLVQADKRTPLRKVLHNELVENSFVATPKDVTLNFSLPRGESRVELL